MQSEGLTDSQKLLKIRDSVLQLLENWQALDKNDIVNENTWLGDQLNGLCGEILELSGPPKKQPSVRLRPPIVNQMIVDVERSTENVHSQRLRETHKKLSQSRVRSLSQERLTVERASTATSESELPGYLDLVDHTLPKLHDSSLPNSSHIPHRLFFQSATRGLLNMNTNHRRASGTKPPYSGHSDSICELKVSIGNVPRDSGSKEKLTVMHLIEEDKDELSSSIGRSKTSPRRDKSPRDKTPRDKSPRDRSPRGDGHKSPRRPSTSQRSTESVPRRPNAPLPTGLKRADKGKNPRSESISITFEGETSESTSTVEPRRHSVSDVSRFLPVSMPRTTSDPKNCIRTNRSDGVVLDFPRVEREYNDLAARAASAPLSPKSRSPPKPLKKESPRSPRGEAPATPHKELLQMNDEVTSSSGSPPYATLTKRNRSRNLTLNNTPEERSDQTIDLSYPLQPSTFKASEFLIGQQDADNIYNMRLARVKLVERAPSSTLLFDEVSSPRQLTFPPVLALEGTPGSQLYLPIVKSRVLAGHVSTISILPESNQWNARTFIVEQHRSIFDREYAPYEHLIWVGIAFQDHQPGDSVHPYFFVTACRRDSSIFFLETSNQGHHEWQRTITAEQKKSKTVFRFINSKGKLCPKMIEQELASHYQFAHFHLLPPRASQSLLKIDKLIVDSKHMMDIGILYRKKGQWTRDEIAANRDLPYGKFLAFLRAVGCPIAGDPHNRTSIFNRNIEVKWLLAVDYSPEDFRRYIGNSMQIIIFNDSDEPFDPMKLFLGKISNLMCVVQPTVSPLLSISRAPTMFRVGFFVQYDATYQLESTIGKVIAENEQLIRTLQFGPEIPANYCFDSLSIGKFVLTKLYNGMLASLRTYKTAKAFFTQPLQIHLNAVVKTMAPDWHSKVTKSLKKMDS